MLYETGHDLVEITRRLGESAERALDPNAPDASSARPSWHAMDADDVIGAVKSHSSGLSEAEAKRRLAETGANAIAPISGRTQLEILLSQFHSLPIALLAAGAVLSIATGGLLDAAIILAVIGLNGAIGFIAEARAEETIGSLSESRAPVSRVLRARKGMRGPGRGARAGRPHRIAPGRARPGRRTGHYSQSPDGERGDADRRERSGSEGGKCRRTAFRTDWRPSQHGVPRHGGDGRRRACRRYRDRPRNRTRPDPIASGFRGSAGDTIATPARRARQTTGVRIGGGMRAVRRDRADPRVWAVAAAEDRDLARGRGSPRGFADPRHDDARAGNPGFAPASDHHPPAERGGGARRGRNCVLRQDRHIDAQRYERRSLVLEPDAGAPDRRAVPHRNRSGRGPHDRSRAGPAIGARNPLQ